MEPTTLDVSVEFFEYDTYEAAREVFDRLEPALRESSCWTVKDPKRPEVVLLGVVYESVDRDLMRTFDFGAGRPAADPDPKLAWALVQRRYRVIGDVPEQIAHYERGAKLSMNGEMTEVQDDA